MVNHVASGAFLDDGKGFWESYWAEGHLTSGSVLIGLGSSAQVMPKLVFDIEPTVVFLNKLYRGNGTSGDYGTVEDLMERYDDKRRIAVPTSNESLRISILDSLTRNAGHENPVPANAV